jgi:hypothetical protein
VLRTSRGLTYGAQAEMDTLRESGDFEASTNTRSEATGEVLRLMVDEFWRLQRERVRERELADAKAYITGSFPLTIETPDAIATQVLNVLFYGLPVEELQSFRDRVNAVTVDDIERVARAYLRPDRLSIVLVGNAAAFTPQLRGIGFGTYETVNMPDLDLTTPDFKARPGARAPAGGGPLGAGRQQRVAYAGQSAARTPPVTPGRENAARDLLDRTIAAKGGLDKLRAVKNIKAVTTSDLPASSGAKQARTTTYLQYPDRVRVETIMPDAEIVQVFDGQHAWVKDPRGVHEVPDRAVQELQGNFRRDTLAVLLAAKAGQLRARLLPDSKDDSGRVRHALEVSGRDLEPMVLYIDPDTNLIVKQTYVAGGLGQPLIEEILADYKAVDGVQIAFSATVRRGGVAVLDRQVHDIVINGPMDQALFTRPTF